LGGFRLFESIEETRAGYPDLHVFLSRLFKTKLAIYIETTMARPGGESPHNFMNTMMRLLGWAEHKRPILDDYLREGKCWAAICGGYDGVLCLVTPDPEWLDLALYKDEVARLHAELDTDFVRRMCASGSIVQRSIWECLELPEFMWESAVTTWLPVERISPLVAPFRLLRECHYDAKSGYYWPRPAGWTWDWPADPSAVRPGDKQCSLCPRKLCHCAEVKIPQIPRILDDRSRGPGIRAVGSYRTHDILGELAGELVPPGACAGDWGAGAAPAGPGRRRPPPARRRHLPAAHGQLGAESAPRHGAVGGVPRAQDLGPVAAGPGRDEDYRRRRGDHGQVWQGVPEGPAVLACGGAALIGGGWGGVQRVFAMGHRGKWRSLFSSSRSCIIRGNLGGMGWVSAVTVLGVYLWGSLCAGVSPFLFAFFVEGSRQTQAGHHGAIREDGVVGRVKEFSCFWTFALQQ
jgi:hypothetical protein